MSCEGQSCSLWALGGGYFLRLPEASGLSGLRAYRTSALKRSTPLHACAVGALSTHNVIRAHAC